MSQHKHSRGTVRPACLLGGFAVAVLAGCATQSPPGGEEIRAQAGRLSQMPLEQPWREAGASSGGIQDNWLATFDDPQLNALVEEALRNNPDLAIAAVKVEQAEQYVELAKAALRPSINLFGVGGLNMGGGDISSALQGASLGISWEPDLWGRLRYGRNAAQSTYASMQADYEFARQSLAAAVARGWFTATETRLQLGLAEEAVLASGDLVGLADKRWQVGAGSEQDVVLARANLSRLEDATRQVQLAHNQSLRALEILLGRYPAAELQARKELTSMPGPLPSGFPLQMLERRPDMVAAEQRVAAAFNRVGEAKAAKLPNISLNANVAAISSEILQLQEDFDSPTGGAGARLLAPIYTGGALTTQVEIRTLEQKEAVADYARKALLALSDVENGLAASESLSAREILLARAVGENRRALELVNQSFRVGRTDMRAVQQQLINLQSAQQALLRVQSEQLSQRANLHLVLGGSFAAPVPVEPTDSEGEDLASN
ncbi:MAG TPA: efflux transporter outer membrane subunit [Xanthomonadales bacterium]|nr:efflux transporter outer membrane subunit [Xanthomonadales bacterium]